MIQNEKEFLQSAKEYDRAVAEMNALYLLITNGQQLSDEKQTRYIELVKRFIPE